MEPIVLLGLVIVAYGGYVALLDLCDDLSLRMPRRISGALERLVRRERIPKPQVKKMAGMHV